MCRDGNGGGFTLAELRVVVGTVAVLVAPDSRLSICLRAGTSGDGTT